MNSSYIFFYQQISELANGIVPKRKLVNDKRNTMSSVKERLKEVAGNHNRYKIVSLFTVYTSVATNLSETKYIKVWRSKHTYESQYPNKQCQQLVLGTCTPKTGYWACIDKSNGDQENTWYVWLFRSLKEANLHIQNQKLKPDCAELSLPVPVISIKSV